MNLALHLTRDLSPAAYLQERRSELLPDSCAGGERMLSAALEAARALEEADRGRAHRAWSALMADARSRGRGLREQGRDPRSLIADVDRVRDRVDLVLFDGRLPSDLAARAARLASKMAARWLDCALSAYWCPVESGLGEGRGVG